MRKSTSEARLLPFNKTEIIVSIPEFQRYLSHLGLAPSPIPELALKLAQTQGGFILFERMFGKKALPHVDHDITSMVRVDRIQTTEESGTWRFNEVVILIPRKNQHFNIGTDINGVQVDFIDTGYALPEALISILHSKVLTDDLENKDTIPLKTLTFEFA